MIGKATYFIGYSFASIIVSPINIFLIISEKGISDPINSTHKILLKGSP